MSSQTGRASVGDRDEVPDGLPVDGRAQDLRGDVSAFLTAFRGAGPPADAAAEAAALARAAVRGLRTP